jgi:chaperone required for assembly of F1-ATPase
MGKQNAATNHVYMYSTSTKNTLKEMQQPTKYKCTIRVQKKNKNAAISHAHQRVHKKQQKNTNKKINAATNLVSLYQPSPQ